MRAKIGLITAFLLIVALAPGLAFYDDFQSYNSVTDASFTSNYTLYNTANDAFNIGQAPGDSLSLNIIPGYTHNFVIINESKLNLSYPFEISITLRKGTMVLSANHPKFIFSFFTNASNATDISGSRGYQVVYDLNDSVIDFRRCGVSIENAPCGVSLNNSIMNSSIIGFQITESGIANLTNDIVFILSIDSSKRFHFYANNIEYMNYYDTAETYLSGGLIFGQQQDNIYNHWHYWDNINSNATIGAPTVNYNDPANWHILGWLNNIENLPGYYQSASHNVISGINCYWSFKDKDVCVRSCELGLMAGCDGYWGGYWGGSPAQIKAACGIYACDVTNITYSLHGSTVTETTNSPLGSGYDDFALPAKYYDGITAYFYVMGQPFTESIRAGIHILPYMRLKASAPGCSYVSPLKWYAIYAGQNVNLAQYESPIPITDNNDYWGGNYWKHDNSGDYLISITDGFVCNNSNNVTVSYDFYNTQTSALLFTKDVTFPVGYVTTATGTGIGSNFSVNYSLPFDCIFNASICAGAGNLPTFNQTCTPGVNCPVTPSTTTPLISDFGGLSGLVTPLTVLLSAVLIAGAIITRDTKSSQIGLIVIMAGCLMLSFYGILPWYITVLITIGAGFFILSQVRTGVFGNAQSA